MVTPVYTFDNTDVSEEFAPVSFTDTLGAQLGYQYAPIADKIEELREFSGVAHDPDFNWSTAIQGYEQHAKSLLGAKNQQHFDFLRENLDRNLDRRNTLARSTMFQSLGAGLLDPINLAFPLPILKAAGAIVKGAAGIGAGAVAGAKGGLIVGGASELIRAPFDPLATTAEVSLNMGANVVLGGVVGAAPSAIRQAYTHRKAQQRNYEVGTAPGTAFGDDVDGIKIDYDVELDGRSVGVELKNNTVFVDREIINETYYKKPWTKPVDGSAPLAQGDIPSPIEYSDFLVHREILRKSGGPKSPKARIQWLDRTNKQALDRMTSGYSKKKTKFSESWFNRAISTPLKRNQAGNYPEVLKKGHSNLVEKNSMALQRAERGLPTESIDQNIKRYQATTNNLISELQDLHAQNAMGRQEFPTLLGTRDEDITKLLTKTKGFSEEFSDMIKLRTEIANPNFNRTLTDYEKNFIAKLDSYFDGFLGQAQDVGFMQSVTNVPSEIKTIKKNLTEFQDAYKANAIEEGSTLDTLSMRQIKNLEKRLKFLEGLPQHKQKQRFLNRMWRSREIGADSNMRNKLINKLERRNRANPAYRFWDDAAEEWVTLSPREHAERIVDNIIHEQAFDPSQTSISSTKHFNHRTLGDIPDHELVEFLHTDPSILHTYSQKVGLAIEWRKFNGDKTVDEFLEEAEILMVKNKNTVDEIVDFKRDYMADFEALSGTTITDPARFDNRIAQFLKGLTQMTYLGRAYQATLGDMHGIVGQHGLKKSFVDPWFSSIDRTLAGQTMTENRKLIEGLSYANNAHSNRMVTENTRIGEQYREEKIMNSLVQKFHTLPGIGSMLTPVTKGYRHLDGILRSDKIIENSILWRDGKLDQSGIEEMARMGLDKDTSIAISNVKKLNGDLAYNKGDALWFANISEWPNKSPKDREIKRKFVNALENGMHNAIVIATHADKPIVVRGAAYVQYRSFHKALGYEPDMRVSFGGKKVIKVSSGALSLPFMFQSFGLGALPRVVGRLTDPVQKNRVTQALFGIGMGYAVLKLRKSDWWFEENDWNDKLARSIDYAGLTGIYGDIFYTSLEMMAGAGIIDEKTSIIKPKYFNIDGVDAMGAPFGAPAGLVQGYMSTIKKFVEGDTDEAVREFARNTPNLLNFPFQYDFGDLAEDIGIVDSK